MHDSRPFRQFLTLTALALAATTDAAAASITYGVSTAQFMQSGLNGTVYTDEDFTYGGTTGTSSLSQDGISLFGSANLATGQLRVSNSGTVPGGYGGINAGAFASFIDTITATGSTGGLNLGVNLTIDGSTTSTLPNNTDVFLRIQIYQPGHFQAAIDGLVNFYDPSALLWGTAFSLGSQSNTNPNVSPYGVTVAGHYNNGTVVVPLNIPYGLIGTQFEIQIALHANQGGSAAGQGQSWNSDYSHTIGVELSGGNGVTLQSNSGVLPGATSAVPEPGSYLLFSAGGLAMLVLRHWRR